MNISISSLLYQTSAVVAGVLGRKRKFMNLGFEGSQYAIKPEDKADGHHIALYIELLKMAEGIDEKGKTWSALEIGCGRGGGCYVMKNYFGITDITGMDLSAGNIKLAKKFVPKGKFLVADASDFKTDSIYDLILNRESSHAYPSRAAFFKNVAGIINANSFFVFGDLIKSSKLHTVEDMITKSGLKIVASKTINQNVLASLEKHSGKHYPLPTRFPFLFPRQLHNFFVTKH